MRDAVRILTASLGGACLLFAASQSPAFEVKLRMDDDPRVCTVTEMDAYRCCDGDFVLYKPRYFGNPQLPVEFVAVFCDHKKSVIWSTGAGASTYSGKKETYSGDEPSEKRR